MGDANADSKGRRSHGNKEIPDPTIGDPQSVVRKEKKVVWEQPKSKDDLSFFAKPKKPTFIFFSVSHIIDGTANEALLYVSFFLFSFFFSFSFLFFSFVRVCERVYTFKHNLHISHIIFHSLLILILIFFLHFLIVITFIIISLSLSLSL